VFLGLTPANLPGVYPRETDNLFQAAAQLPEGAPVLIAVDYDSAFAGEMQSAAAPVINLLKTRKSRFSLLSTSVSGTALAMQLMGYESSDQIIYLGYLPGGQMAIPTLFDDMLKLLPVTSDARFTAVHPAMAGVRNLADYKTVILMTDNPETARAWIEQLTIVENSPPIWLVTSAQAAPMMRPYIRSGQVNAGITGSLGGAQFEVRLNSAGTNIERWNSYYWSLFGGLMVMLLGGIINLLFHSVLTPQKG
jgi:hypothetical protein